ncbi:BREX-1 system adenine-specific DNA-methyltransferase PglX [Salinibacterium sp. SWN1162]|uniref:BREX-1 system adenine-specific DNA-methyltransferase PglX n=1 Tax=Salinibacterium sp. SWN1162 TaxID=2792053 RepID=UPI0018CEDDE3|nr:BREX-1 system adenine-specific DNA-methyltransferase PglX [Salinibacterium sp. SWN1162]MBH0009577.1 BREX-1 system adenine-specific DNA-methyltransferase PglX [Salinibacterium sp. SWN1162]
MHTKPLERFATQARRDLIATVDAQATAVLSHGSVARSERAHVVKRLEEEIAAHGRAHVIDKVAYTWFNRIIALRFMDARGYTDAGVVSPAQGQSHGQPEILADAKRGNLDTDVMINKNTAEAIIGLLDGTRRSTDAEGEAYALLLTEYCRYWHKSMPFMFEREGDFTELLVPTGLLADGAILSRAREVLTEEVCEDVEVIGWLYQFYISERKDEVFAGFKRNEKAGADEIPAATQLFTPHWIVRYLVENSLGRLWMLNRPASQLVDQMDYYIPSVDEGTDFLKINEPEELTVIDPACGSGHMLTYAFDLLYAIYEEQGYAPSKIPSLILNHNLHGTEIDPRAGSLAAFALTMKARAQDRRFFSKNLTPKIQVIEPIAFGQDELNFLVAMGNDRRAEEVFWSQFEHADTLGALIQSDASETARARLVFDQLAAGGDILHVRTLEDAQKVLTQADVLSQTYSVVVANPPYMGSKNMNAQLATFAKERYPAAKGDLMTMFMMRASAFTCSSGWWGMINLPSWMSLSGFVELRSWLLRSSSLDTLLHFGRGVFGSDFGSVGFVVENVVPNAGRRGIYRKLFDEHVKVRSNEKIEALFHNSSFQSFVVVQSNLMGIPGSPIAYWLSDAMRAAFTKGRPLRADAEPRQGLATADNDRFLRSWWEVSAERTAFGCADRNEAKASGARWFPYNKGGEYRKWWGNHEHVLNWECDGKELYSMRPKSVIRSPQTYFQTSLSWSKVSSGPPAFRIYPAGFAYDVAGTSIFTPDSGLRNDLAAFANSSVALEMLKAIAPTLNYEVGQIAQLPVIPLTDTQAGEIASQAVNLSRQDWNDFETSWDFESPSIMAVEGSSIADRYSHFSARWAEASARLQDLETKNNELIAAKYDVAEVVACDVALSRVSLARNVQFRYGPEKSPDEYSRLERADLAAEIVSYAVGCLFGRYSLDEVGLILADQGSTLHDYFAKVPSPTFAPDADNVIPFVDDGWFQDDIVERFRQFLQAAFGRDNFEENLRFVEDSLGVNTLRDYFVTNAGKSKFYDDHVQRYKKRPIYWMFSSPNGSFNALIYMHRYSASTVSTVLNEYLREYRAKLEVALTNAEQAASAGSAKDQKETDRLRKVLAELRDYEHDVLYPLATQQIVIDLDDGVKVNYPKFYPALKKIAGLETAE